MRIILSRKGFDSKYGGYPSPILPDGRMVSLPIPRGDETRYSDLRIDNETYYDFMERFRPEIKDNGIWTELTEETRCHVDPDIYADVLPRYKDWKPCFGQMDAAQSHLDNQNVQVGDLFLFFGWYRKTKPAESGDLKFYGKDFHSLFGYLEVGRKTKCCKNYKEPIWMRGHPHLMEERRVSNNNTIYMARDKLSWDSSIPGGGAFQFNENLVLTKEGLSRSRWSLPDSFRSVDISYHSENSWKDGYFQSATIGQEFVIDSSEEIENWARGLIEKHGAIPG